MVFHFVSFFFELFQIRLDSSLDLLLLLEHLVEFCQFSLRISQLLLRRQLLKLFCIELLFKLLLLFLLGSQYLLSLFFDLL
jgi:hypothetical protein